MYHNPPGMAERQEAILSTDSTIANNPVAPSNQRRLPVDVSFAGNPASPGWSHSLTNTAPVKGVYDQNAPFKSPPPSFR